MNNSYTRILTTSLVMFVQGIFQNIQTPLEIRRSLPAADKEVYHIENLINWLSNAPKYTTFRVNLLKQFDPKALESHLISQSTKLDSTKIPKFYLLKNDCLVLEQWPKDTKFEPTGKEVVVDAACAAAVLRGAHVFAPGVMGMSPGYQQDDRVDIYGDMEGKCKKGLKIPYEGKKQLVGIGELKMLRHQLYGEGHPPSGIAIQTILPSSRLPVVNETLYPKGHILLQNLPSLVCGWVVDAQPNEKILDMCAAPGNKTMHLAEMSNNKALIIALDRTRQKVERIKENAEIQGVTCVKTYTFDSTKCFSECSKGIDGGPPFPENSFDKILLDAPCSGLGQRPQLLNKMTPNMLSSYKFVQRKLMNAAVALLKPGGRLVYSTCTVTEDENEGLVAWALREHRALRLVAAAPLLAGPGWAGCLPDEQRILVQRFGPEDDPLRHVEPIYRDTIGFFIACFTKVDII